jgi:hypothetical protein
MLRLFLAYGGTEAERVARLLHEYLNKLGRPEYIEFEAFMAPDDTGMSRWKEDIQYALQRADVLLVVWAGSSSESGDLKEEIEFAKEWGLLFHTFLDDRINKRDSSLPKVLRDYGIDHYNAGHPEDYFSPLALKLEQIAFGIPYGGLKLVEAVRE